MKLHEEMGPRNTTIKAIAERAGVQRLTVYRHFPSDVEVFDACTSHWSSLNPPPDSRPWETIADPVMRAVVALSELYAYFSRTQGMWRVSYRDVGEVPALQAPMCQRRSKTRPRGGAKVGHPGFGGMMSTRRTAASQPRPQEAGG